MCDPAAVLPFLAVRDWLDVDEVSSAACLRQCRPLFSTALVETQAATARCRASSLCAPPGQAAPPIAPWRPYLQQPRVTALAGMAEKQDRFLTVRLY